MTRAALVPILALALGPWSGVRAAEPLPEGVHADLSLLAELTEGADLLGVGESIHLSGGLERARAEILLHAVEELGFRVVAAELSWFEGRQVDAELMACAGGGRDRVEAPFADPLWDGLRAPLQALCARNAARPEDPVRFVGFDVQDSWNHRDLLEEATGKGPDAALRRCHGAWVDSAAALSAWGKAHGYPRPTPEDQDACLARLDALEAALADPTLRLALASLRATQLANFAHLARGDLPAAYEAREAALHPTLLGERARVGGGRTVLLAHDDHVGRTAPGYRPLGARLAAEPGLTYVALAVGGARVGSRLGKGLTLDPPAPGSVEAAWAALPPARVLVDRRALGEAHDARLYLDEAPAE